MAATVGELNIKLNLELQRLDEQIQKANAKIKGAGASWQTSLGKSAKAINGTLATLGAGLSIGALVNYGKACIDLGGQLVDLSAQAGLGTDAFQTMRLAAMENGSSGEEVANVFAKMNRSMQEAIEGSKAQAEAFAKLNLGAAYLKTLAPEKRFELIARAVVGATDQQEAYNAAADIFGAKVGPKMNQLLKEMASVGFEKMSEGVKGIRLTPEQLKSLDDAGDKMARLWEIAKVFGARGILATASVVDPSQVELLNSQIENLERLKKEGKITIGWNSKDDIVNVSEMLNKLTAARDRLAGKATSGVSASTDPATTALEKKAQAAAEQVRIDARNLEIIKATDAAEKSEAEAKKEQAKSAADYNKALAETDSKMSAIREAALSLADPTREYQKQMEDLWAAMEYFPADADNIVQAMAKVREEMNKVGGENQAKFEADNLKAMEEEARKLQRAADDIGDAFASSFENAIMSGGSLGDMLKGIGDDLLAMIIRMQITVPMAKAISDGISGSGGEGLGGFIGSLFGGMKASGGPVSGGTSYIVGEKGPELFTPSSSGSIMSNADTIAAASGGGGTTVTVVQNFAAGVSQSQLMEGLRQTKSAAEAGVMDAIQRRKGGFGAIAIG